MAAAFILVCFSFSFLLGRNSRSWNFPPCGPPAKTGFVVNPCACGVFLLSSNLRVFSLWLVPLHALGFSRRGGPLCDLILKLYIFVACRIL